MSNISIGHLNPALNPPIGIVPESRQETRTETKSFSDILNSAIGESEGIHFSKHAQMRLDSRDIELEQGDLQKLGDAVDKASQKGIRDSLMLMNDVAYIVSVPGRTVVTAMPADEAKEKIFTNIDGAMIL